MAEGGCTKKGIIARVVHLPFVLWKKLIHILGHRTRHSGNLEETMAAVTAFSREVGRFGRGQAFQEISVDCVGGCRLFNWFSKLFSPVDHFRQGSIVQAAIGCIYLVSQDDPAGLFFAANKGAIIAKSPGDVVLRNETGNQQTQEKNDE